MVKICRALDCDNPVEDGRRLYCSQVCADVVDELKKQQRQDRAGRLKRVGRVCAVESCSHLVYAPRRRYCSTECAAKVQRVQSQESSRVGRKRVKIYRPKQRHRKERRTIRGMQHVDVERWKEYEFEK